MTRLLFAALLAAVNVSYHVVILQPANQGMYKTYAGEVCPAVEGKASCFETKVKDHIDAQNAVIRTNPDVVLDLTDKFDVGLSLSMLATELSFLHIYSLHQQLHGSQSYALHQSYEFAESLIRKIFDLFGWTKALVVGSPDPVSVELTQGIVHISSEFAGYFLSPELDPELMETTLTRAVRATGRNVVLVASHPDVSLRILEASKKRGIMKEGYAYIVLEEALPEEEWIRNFQGVFFVTGVNQLANVTRKSLFLQSISTCFSYSLDDLPSFLSQQLTQPPLYLYNIQAAGAVLFATFYRKSVIYENITAIFPGPTKHVPPIVLPLKISISNSTENPTSSKSVDLESTIKASLLAVKDVNEKLNLLPNYVLTYSGLEYGCVEFEPNWATSHLLPSLPYLGSSIVNSPSSLTAIGLMQLLQNWNLTRPVVGSNGSMSQLSSSHDFPYYIRISLPDYRLVTVYCQILKYYNWLHIAVLYESQNAALSGQYSNLKSVANSTGITILNPEDQRALNSSLSSDLNGPISSILASKARVMMFLISDPMANAVMKMMYQMGVRRGDVIFFSPWVDVDLITDFAGEDKAIHEELLYGSVKPSPLNFRGPFGSKVYRSLSALGFVPRFNDCQFYDAILTLAHSFRFLIQEGENYEDAAVLMAELRQTKFVGCSGLVYLEEGTNDRARMAFQVLNLVQAPATSTWSMQQILVFDPESTRLFQRINPEVWPDGGTTPLTDFAPPTDCPDERHLNTFVQGEQLVMAVCFALLGIIAGVTGYIWSRWWRLRYPRMAEKQEISVADVMLFVGIGVEFFQVLGMGPDITDLTSVIKYISDTLSMNFNALVIQQQDFFWLLLHVIFSSCALWILFLFLTYFQLFERLRLHTLSNISELWLPLVGDYAFLPIVSQLMEVFMCDRAYKDTFVTSVLAKDCHYLCWGLTHSLYVAGCSILLLLWVPLAVFTRPLWQELQPLLHVKTQPLHKLLSTVFQIALIVLNKTVKRVWPFAHSITFLLLTAAMVLWIARFRPHNYARVNLWHAGAYIGALWMSATHIVALLSGYSLLPGLILLIGWLLLLLVCILLQLTHFPSLLYRKPRKDTQKLFRFAFTFRPTESLGKIEFNKLNTVREATQAMQAMQATNAREFTLNPQEEEVSARCESVLS